MEKTYTKTEGIFINEIERLINENKSCSSYYDVINYCRKAINWSQGSSDTRLVGPMMLKFETKVMALIDAYEVIQSKIQNETRSNYWLKYHSIDFIKSRIDLDSLPEEKKKSYHDIILWINGNLPPEKEIPYLEGYEDYAEALAHVLEG